MNEKEQKMYQLFIDLNVTVASMLTIAHPERTEAENADTAACIVYEFEEDILANYGVEKPRP